MQLIMYGLPTYRLAVHVHYTAVLLAFCAFNAACSDFHASYSFRPSSLSKKARICGRKCRARISNSCFGILYLFVAIRQHGCYLDCRAVLLYIFISKSLFWLCSSFFFCLCLRSRTVLFFCSFLSSVPPNIICKSAAR